MLAIAETASFVHIPQADASERKSGPASHGAAVGCGAAVGRGAAVGGAGMFFATATVSIAPRTRTTVPATQACFAPVYSICHQSPLSLRPTIGVSWPPRSRPITGYALPGPLRRFTLLSATTRGSCGSGVELAVGGASVGRRRQGAVGGRLSARRDGRSRFYRRNHHCGRSGCGDSFLVGIGATVGERYAMSFWLRAPNISASTAVASISVACAACGQVRLSQRDEQLTGIGQVQLVQPGLRLRQVTRPRDISRRSGAVPPRGPSAEPEPPADEAQAAAKTAMANSRRNRAQTK